MIKMLKSNHKINIFKGENGFTRQILLILYISLITQILFIPTHAQFEFSGFYWYGFYGLHFFYEYASGEFQWWFFTGDLLHTLPVIPAIIIYIILTLKLNTLNRIQKLVLGYTTALLFSLTLILYPLMCFIFCLSCLSRFFFTSVLIILFYTIVSVVLTLHMTRKKDKIHSIGVKEGFLNKTEIISSIFLIRRLYLVLLILLIMLLFSPVILIINFYEIPPNLYYMHIFLGIIIDKIGTSIFAINFDFLSLFQAIPLIISLALLITIIQRYRTLERKILLNLGIGSSFLICISPILYYCVNFILFGPIYSLISCFNLHFIFLSAVLIFLGTIRLSRIYDEYINKKKLL